MEEILTEPAATLCIFIYRNLTIPALRSMLGMNRSRLNWRITFEFGDALISRARSIAATKFLLHSADDVLVMSDDDFGFSPEGLESVVDLVRSTGGIVAGVTPLKSGEYTAIVPLEGPLDVEPWRDATHPPMKIKYAGGLIGYPRTVFEKMAETLPLLHKDSSIEPFYPFFMPMVVGEEYLSEDYACHQRARDCGFDVWVQPRCAVAHLASSLLVTTANMDIVRGLY